jgi:hypothetical protein
MARRSQVENSRPVVEVVVQALVWMMVNEQHFWIVHAQSPGSGAALKQTAWATAEELEVEEEVVVVVVA